MIKYVTKKKLKNVFLLMFFFILTGLNLQAQNKEPTIRGIVKDKKGVVVASASVVLYTTEKRIKTSYTDKNGVFIFPDIPPGKYVIMIKHVGFKYKEIDVEIIPGGTFSSVIELTESVKDLDEVKISTGIVQRSKNGFTGATATFTGEQLKSIGNQNIIQSLKTLDPSFIQIQNNLAGSNPNVLPKIEIRGKTSIGSTTLQDQFASDPNQPLFILDGFETSLTRIVSIDMNRIASVTILKDAASTALYGSKASNGVVVIETKKPKPGELQLNYTTDLSVELPDLSGYNMMNAEEKLQFEKLAGRYTLSFPNAYLQQDLDAMYANRLKEVKRGVNSYWLSEPLQTGFSQRHFLYASGGAEAIKYGVGASYKTNKATMKGSGRDEWGANIDLSYRKGKFNISNTTEINGYKTTESPYGSFSTYVKANPYYRKLGTDLRFLEQTYNIIQLDKNYDVTNPLYNAALNSYDGSKNFAIQNAFQVKVNLTDNLLAQVAFQIQKGITTGQTFISPLNTIFDSTNAFEKGSYTNNRSDNFNYNGYLMLSYGKVFKEKHALTTDLRAEIREDNNQYGSYTAVGFPNASNGNPSFAYSYQPNSRPSSVKSKSRSDALLFTANYIYDKRYFADASIRYDGSTAFGSSNPYTPYYSGGLGWNVNNEKGIKDIKWITLIRLRANIGVTGNQNFSSYSSIDTYNYFSGINPYGQGVLLSTLGNPNLEAQKTVQSNIGTDIALWGNQLNFTINAYRKKTSPLVVAVDLPSSTGVSKLPLNVGYLDTKGLEAVVNFSPIYKPNERIIWTIGYTGSIYKSKYGNFNNTLASLNTAQLNSNSLIRYKDGYSPDDLWAVPSKGIDPATGREVFLKKNGEYTFTYDPADIVKSGSGTPLIEGVISTSFNYKGASLGIYLRYVLGRDIFNNALYSKVENISFQGLSENQDKRALYDRWQKPGDNARFKGISLTSTTPISSRFIQQENSLSGESINMGYRFDQKTWLKKVGISSLILNAYMNDLFYFSTVKRERGIDYPYAKSFSFSLNASF
ncbi:SusC/RagA family TonB-linked outer membrane protein [Pedobacter riviphilus]|uniref:SusC/RagA family TonB-linked outer membrane protein n=1 Tax=Pedobacter riviphilus TaxID=2766984 RepID=A0ABX6TH14_9SPHI|nr:SusC/RagA family TonB-linked outer membrane protein [Pedobacter riviphilus]QNR84758.1 SusC/RagA family TonB-linked outer membrane protein [Pedobacter riviphilus]